MDGNNKQAILLYITQAVVGALCVALAFLFNQGQTNKDELLRYKVHIAEVYAKKQDVKQGFKDVNQRLDKLFEEITKERQ